MMRFSGKYEKFQSDPDIYVLQVPSGNNSAIQFTDSYLIVMGERNLLVDTGVYSEQNCKLIKNALNELGIDMANTDIFLTHLHNDHVGLAAAIADKQSEIYLSEKDVEALRFIKRDPCDYSTRAQMLKDGYSKEDIDLMEIHNQSLGDPDLFKRTLRHLSDGDELKYGRYRLQVIDAPGHTPGGQCLYLPDQQTIFLGDHILMKTTPHIASFFEGQDLLKDYMESIEWIKSLPVKYCYMGHEHADPERNAKKLQKRIDSLESHHMERLEEVFEIVQQKPGLQAMEIAKRVSWHLPCRDWESIPAIQKWFIVNGAVTYLNHLLSLKYIERIDLSDKSIYEASSFLP